MQPNQEQILPSTTKIQPGKLPDSAVIVQLTSFIDIVQRIHGPEQILKITRDKDLRFSETEVSIEETT